MGVITESTLGTTLLDFQRIFNDHTRVKKLLKKWERDLYIEATDTNEHYKMVVRDRLISHIDMLNGRVNFSEIDTGQADQGILLQAEADILERIFSGDYNPATAHIDGALAVFSSERDKVKLEAISMVVWGLS